jgi:undecaprenyl-diphosphatase
LDLRARGTLAFLEAGAFLGLLVPGETATILGGVVAGQGEIDIVVLIALVWTAAFAGDLTGYWLGRRLGRAFLIRHGPRFGFTAVRLEQVEQFFDRHGGKAVFLGRFVGIVRSLAPFLAGSSRMPLGRFVAYDILGRASRARCCASPATCSGSHSIRSSASPVRALLRSARRSS